MATQYSNKPIVTNGLVYALDFGNQKSYVSGSNSARNLLFSLETSSFLSVGTGNTPNLVNGLLEFNPLPSSGNPLTGSMLVKPTNIDALGFGNKEYTIQTVVRPKGFGASIAYDSVLFSQGGGNPNYLVLRATTLGVGFGSYTPGVGEGAIDRTYAGTSQLTHLTYRYRSGSYDLFVNGVPVSASSTSGGSGAGFSTPSLGGANNGAFNGPAFTGSVGNFYVYNRSLSSDEIYSNYLISAQRYGLPTPAKPYSLDENAYLFLQSAGITDPIITSSINTFVLGLKSASLWDKMIAIYPFVGTGSVGVNLTGSHKWNLKEPSLVTYPLGFTGSWNGSVSGSTPSGSNTAINTTVSPSTYYPNYANNNAHISILSYDTPVSSSILAGTGMTKELAVSTLAGDYGTPAAAYSVRKVRTAYSGALMDVRRSIDNVTSSIGYVSSGDLDTGSLLDFVLPGRSTLPGAYSGLAAAYSLRRVSGSYTGSAVRVRGDIENQFRDIGFDASGNLDTGSLLNFTATGSNTLPGSYSGLAAAYSLRRVSSSYSGFAVEVRSGSVSQSIGFDSLGNLDTGSLLTFAGSGDVFVKTWYDQSGNNNHVTQSVDTRQPRIVITGSLVTFNGKPALKFFQNALTAILPNDISGGSVFIPTQNTPTSGITISGITSATWFLSYWTTAPEVMYNTSGTFYKNSSTSALTNNYSSITPALANNTPVLTTGLNTSFPKDIALGGVGTWGSNYSLDALLPEFLIYSSSQAANRFYIENNINAYYNIYTTASTSTENAFVSTWYDQSGNARHATQTATGSQPLIVSSGSLVTQNNRPALSFYGVNNSLVIAGLHGQSNLDTYFVTTTSDVEYLYPFGSGGGDYGFVSQNGSSVLNISNNYGTPSLYANGILFTGSNRGDVSTFLSGSKVAVHQSASTLSWTSYTWGTYSGGLYSYQGTLQELIAYTSSVSASRTFLENNINTYYNVYTSSNAGYVAKWYDQSGNNRHATQTATGSQPLIVNSGSIYTLSGKPAISSSQKQLNLASTATFTDFSFFTVTKKANSTNSQAVLFSSNTFGNGGGDNNDNEGTPVLTNGGANLIAKSLGNSFNFDGTAHHLSYYQRVGSTAVGGYN